MKRILSYKLFEKFKLPTKEELAQKIRKEFNSEEDARIEVDYYLDNILDLQDNGGFVFRLVWLKNKSKLKTKNLGKHWVMDPNVLDRFESGLESGALDMNPDSKPYLIKAKIEPGQIDLESSLSQFLALPQENEINLKWQPKKFNLKKW